MTTASVLISEVRDVLQDTDASAYRWTDAELLRYMSSALKAIVLISPLANITETTHTVSDTNPYRSIPNDGATFVSVIANIAVNGSLSSPPQRTQIDVLNAVDPDWRYTTPASPDADRYYTAYAFDAREPQVFWLYPRPTSGKNVRIAYSKIPATLATTSADTGLMSVYDTPIVEFVLWRALQKEGRTQQPAAAKTHFETFLGLMKVGDKEWESMIKDTHRVDFGNN